MRIGQHLMLNIRHSTPWIGCLLVATAGLVGCAPKTDVSTTANVPSQYSHVFMSVQEIWLNTDATAGHPIRLCYQQSRHLAF